MQTSAAGILWASRLEPRRLRDDNEATADVWGRRGVLI